LMAAIESLPPIEDVSGLDVEREAQPDPNFSLPRFLRNYRAPLIAGLALVVLDALTSLAGPALVRLGLDRGVVHRAEGSLWLVSLLFLGVTLFSWWDEWAQAFYMGRTAERLLYGLRVRIFAHLQRLALDY